MSPGVSATVIVFPPLPPANDRDDSVPYVMVGRPNPLIEEAERLTTRDDTSSTSSTVRFGLRDVLEIVTGPAMPASEPAPLGDWLPITMLSTWSAA